MNYIKIFQNAHALSISVVNYYSEDQLRYTFLDNCHQGGKYSAQIASHQVELALNISSIQTDYLNLDSSSGFRRNSERENTVQKKCTFCGGANQSTYLFPKGSDRKRKNLVRLVIQTIDVQSMHLKNVLHVDLKIN